MADLVKGVLGERWSLVVGWMLPTFLSLQLIAFLVLPAFAPHSADIERFLRNSVPIQQVTILAVAAVVGVVLAAAQSQLYRVLEGYTLWPGKLAEHRINRHRARRARLMAKQQAVAVTSWGVKSGLLYQQAARYPASDRQVAPTMLGNSIRRFETYAGDRYMMDSQLLWSNLTAAAPASAVNAVESARTNVDFFVCLLYGSAVAAIAGGVASGLHGLTIRTSFAMGLGIASAVISYVLAVVAADEWDAAFRAVVDHGRVGVAAAFGMSIPDNFNEERLLWRTLNTLVRRPYAYSETKDVAGLIEKFRTQPKHEAPLALAEPTACRLRWRRVRITRNRK